MNFKSIHLFALAAVLVLAQNEGRSEPSAVDLNRAYLDSETTLRLAAEDANISTRAFGMEAIGQVLGDDAGANLVQGLEDASPLVRFAAAMAIGDANYQPALAALVAKAQDKTGEQDKRVFCGILYALFRLGDTSHLQSLALLLQDPEASVRANAALVMGKIGNRSAIGPLKSMLADEINEGAKYNITEALALLGDGGKQQLLEAYVRGYFMDLRLSAMPALARCNAPGAWQILKEQEAWGNPARVRIIAAGAVGLLDGEHPGGNDGSGYDLCVEACRNPAPLAKEPEDQEQAFANASARGVSLQRLAALSLGWMRNIEAVPVLARLLTHADGGVRVAAAESIIRLLSVPSTENDGGTYEIDRFVLAYRRPVPGLPDLDGVMKMDLVLRKTANGWIKARQIAPTTTFHLADLATLREHRFRGSAIQSINEQIVSYFNKRGLVGVFVWPDQGDIDPKTGQDKRLAAGKKTLHLNIATAVVSQVRTVASGERFGGQANVVDLPAYQHLAANSPLKAATRPAADSNSLLWKEALDKYVYFLNRQPGRKVSTALSSAGANGDVVLDYLVTENKPWSVYFQMLNTGTKFTTPWRERFGFIDTQVSGHDDILSLDYVTGGFETDHQLAASYEAPFFWQWDRLRWRVYGNWGTFTASDVGIVDENFTGTDWLAGAEVIANVFQHKDLFVDVLAGAHYRHIDVNNQLLALEGESGFFLPHLGLRLDRTNELATTAASVTGEFNSTRLGDTNKDELDNLGRLDTDAAWAVLKWDILQSFYLEPLLQGKQWKSADANAGVYPHLANELAFWFRGQYAGDYRLIPQAEDVIGGMYSVRGYPEAAAAGDSMMVGTAEYRYHIARALDMVGEPPKVLGKPFRTGNSKYGPPDWDLIGRVFFDVGRSVNNRILEPLEENETLMSTGLGLELQVLRNFSIRCDWGIALRDMANGEAQAGDNRFHIVGTVRY